LSGLGSPLAVLSHGTPRRRHSARLAASLARPSAVSALAGLAIAGLAACGGGQDTIVVRVGQVGIASGTVERWMSATAGGHLPSSSARRRALRAQALDFLISSQWLLGEAAADGLVPSEREVQRQFAREQSASFPGGEQEMHEFLKATGQRISDIVFQAKAELALTKIRQALLGRQPPITQAQVVSYYSHHRQRYLIPEQRMVEYTARKSVAAIEAIKREVLAGRSFASFASHMLVSLAPASYSLSFGFDAALARAIHFARLNVLVGPVLVNHIDHYLVVVKKIIPSREQPLTQVQGTIKHQLAAGQAKRTLSTFIRAWRKKWVARTGCDPGYVVQKCREYAGARTPEDPTTFD